MGLFTEIVNQSTISEKKMKYYVVADVHGFGTLLKKTLKDKGFFDDEEPHKLIVCGDLMDRGKEACMMQDFMLDLMKKDELILIRGNHEDLMLDLLKNFDSYKRDILLGVSHHVHNGTFDTALQLSKMEQVEVIHNKSEFLKRMYESPFVKELIPSSVNYFETKRYVFVHGWIPCQALGISPYHMKYYKKPDWKRAGKRAWQEARWVHGIDAAHDGVILEGETVICGHWHCSYGHAKYEKKGSEFGSDADFRPYIAKGIIAIDACTAHSKKINCLIIRD